MAKTYFESLVDSVADDSKHSLIYSALQILKAALELQESSMKWFERSEDATDAEAAEVAWNTCMKRDEKSKGLLQAYRLLTDREVPATCPCIRKEICELGDIFHIGAF